MSPGWSGGSIPGQDINPELLSIACVKRCDCVSEGSIRMSPSVMCPVQLLLNYQRWRRESPEISSCLSPSSVLGLLNTSYHAVLPQRDCTGSRVLIYRIGQWNPKDWSAFQVFRVSLMTSEIISRENETQRQGVKAIFDLAGWSLSHALQINPSLARKISSVLSDSFPLKIHMHGSDFQDSLSGFFSSHVLPPEYGGHGPGITQVCQGWTNHLLQSENLLQQIAAHPTGDITMTPDDCLITEEGGTL
uniref:Tocopherol (alpha) transfer protein n=1 Tax=Haplochromis burtoni TaxID=8153 RepID=A0A3Q2W4J0_HAPBU